MIVEVCETFAVVFSFRMSLEWEFLAVILKVALGLEQLSSQLILESVHVPLCLVGFVREMKLWRRELRDAEIILLAWQMKHLWS